jgi:hypothetical protein
LNTRIPDTDFIGSWAWLFPVSYLVHITEEYLGDFPRWISRIWGVETSSANFLSWNGAALVLMTVSVLVVLKTRSFRWLLVAFGTSVLVNALAHLLGTIGTGSYSPGLVSGLVLFLPLGAITLRRAWIGVNRRTFRVGVMVGLLMHAAVVLLAFGFARISD